MTVLLSTTSKLNCEGGRVGRAPVKENLGKLIMNCSVTNIFHAQHYNSKACGPERTLKMWRPDMGGGVYSSFVTITCTEMASLGILELILNKVAGSFLKACHSSKDFMSGNKIHEIIQVTENWEVHCLLQPDNYRNIIFFDVVMFNATVQCTSVITQGGNIINQKTIWHETSSAFLP